MLLTAALYLLREKSMKEREESAFYKLGEALYFLYFTIGLIIAVTNIIRGHVPHPMNFVIVVLGILLLLIGKLSDIKSSRRFSLGTKGMSQLTANFYRVGCWISFIGLLLTFVK